MTELLCQIDALEERIARFNEQIETYCVAFEASVALRDTMPGVGRERAELIVSEGGTDMSRFPTAQHLAAWAGLAPGNHESGGKRRSGRTRPGNHALRTGLVQAAQAAADTKGTYLAAQYRRRAARRGKKRAMIAVAHSILEMAYHIIARQEPYRELGADYFDQRLPETTALGLVRRLEKLGYQVTVEALPAAA